MKNKFFYDIEFLEGTQAKRFFGMKYGNTLPTIDLISIGIVRGDGKKYYSISKDFNLKEAWNRYDLLPKDHIRERHGLPAEKEYWIRENVLKPIFRDWYPAKDVKGEVWFDGDIISCNVGADFTYKNMRKLLDTYGKSNDEIKRDIFNFINHETIKEWDDKISFSDQIVDYAYQNGHVNTNELYANYGAYDHVGLCWLYGKMNDLPNGIPMFTNDLQQILATKADKQNWNYNDIYNDFGEWQGSGWAPNRKDLQEKDRPATLQEKIKKIKSHPDWPKNPNPHHALYDAIHDKNVYQFLQRF